MNELKYVIVIPKGFNPLTARAIVFNGILVHSMVVKELVDSGAVTVYSAGFLNMNDGNITCYGESTSLKVKSKPEEDRITIYRTLF